MTTTLTTGCMMIALALCACDLSLGAGAHDADAHVDDSGVATAPLAVATRAPRSPNDSATATSEPRAVAGSRQASPASLGVLPAGALDTSAPRLLASLARVARLGQRLASWLAPDPAAEQAGGSAVGGPKQGPQASGLAGGGTLTRSEGERWLLIDGHVLIADGADAIDDSWQLGPARYLHREQGRYVLQRAIETLPASMNAWRGRALTLYDAAGVVCTARVSDVEVQSRFTDHGVLDGYPSEEPHRRADQAASQAWGEGRVLVVGRLQSVSAACSGALWAMPEGAPTPHIYRADLAPPAGLTRRALAAFRDLPEWASLQQEYLETLEHYGIANAAKRWDRYEGARPSVQVFTHQDRRLVVVIADSGGGCGDPGAQLVAYFEVVSTASAGSRLVDLSAIDRYHVPIAVVDLDADGDVEVITDEGGLDLQQLEGERLDTLLHTRVPDHSYYGCPC